MLNEEVKPLSDDLVCDSYLEKIKAFEAYLSDHVELFTDLDLFKPYVGHIEEIQRQLENVTEFIEDFGDHDSDDDEDEDTFVYNYDELEDELKGNCAECLEDLFSNLPRMMPVSFPGTMPKKYADMFSDVEEFFERYFEETIQAEGLKLYHTLIGAD